MAYKKKEGGYEIGYGKPPAHTRFPHQKRSGTPKKKKSQTLRDLLRAELNGKIRVQDPKTGATTKKTALAMIARAVRNKAIQNDAAAIKLIMSLDGETTRTESAEPPISVLLENDREILARYDERRLNALRQESNVEKPHDSDTERSNPDRGNDDP